MVKIPGSHRRLIDRPAFRAQIVMWEKEQVMRKFSAYGPAIVVLMSVLVAMFIVPGLIERYAYAQQDAKITLARSVLGQDDILRRIDRAISAIADSTEPSVVHIETQFTDASGSNQRSFSSGAGWVFDREGHIVTNAHVVQSARRVSVEFFDGRVIRGEVIGMDPYTDIAVIKGESDTNFFPAMRATKRLPRIGEQVFAFGSPFGFKFSMSEGIISGLGREAAGSNVVGGYTNYIQTDAAVNPGNSGGPLVNSDGQVMGMNVAIATAKSVGESPEASGSDSAGISFAIPLGTIEPIVNQIIKHGSVSRGYLGVRYNGLAGHHVTIPQEDGSVLTGIQVNFVEPDGPSAHAGILADDVIIEIQGSPIINAESLSTLISSSRPGETIDVRVYRKNSFLDIPVRLGKMKDEVLARRIFEPIMMQLGMTLQPSDDGVAVKTVWPGFPGDNAGFSEGDVITAVNAKKVTEYFQFFVLVADEGILTGRRIEFTVRDIRGDVRTISLRLKW
jgi:serine protease Do